MSAGKFVVAVKESAQGNPAVRRLVDRRGETIEFGSRLGAERLAGELSDDGDRVRIQKAAPQEPMDVDGYLIGFPRRFKREPKRATGGTVSFDVTANQYGALGRALVFGAYGLSAGMRYALRDVYPAVEEGTHRFGVDAEPALPPDCAPEVSWRPDCTIDLISRAPAAPDHRAFCEIKTGSASYQRGQLSDMARVARRYDVLKVRVRVRALPAEYTLDVERVATQADDHTAA